MQQDIATVQQGAATTHDTRDQLHDLLNRFEHPLYNFLITLMGSREVAEDCLQQTFLLALEHLHNGKSLNGPWLYKVARSKAIDELRRNQRIRGDIQELELVANVPQSSRSAMAQRTMARLSREEREILYLYDLDGFSAQEIGVVLGLRAGAVRMRVLRAREHFRAVFAAEEKER